MPNSKLRNRDKRLKQSQREHGNQANTQHLCCVTPHENLHQVNIVITSFPVAADVEVDGIFWGSAGEKLTIPCGKRHICVSMPGYAAWEAEIVFRQGVNTCIHARLTKSADFCIING